MTRCSVCDNLEIVEGSQAHWRALSRFHYRSGRAGAVDRVFVLRFRTDRSRKNRSLIASRLGPIGVIVYAMPVLNCALRHRATGGRYLIGSRVERLVLLNRELRTISRVVIHPQFRGIGLAIRLVRETLAKAKSVYVETLAAMGQVNPFFEKAGMVSYNCVAAPATIRLQAALEQAGIGANVLHDPAQLAQDVQRLSKTQQRWILDEMRRFGQSFGKSFKNIAPTPLGLSHFVSSHLLGGSVYYLWRNPCR